MNPIHGDINLHAFLRPLAELLENEFNAGAHVLNSRREMSF
jgi:hypothetical protein